MKLYGARLSPYFERVYLALTLKDAVGEVDYPGIPGGFRSEEFKTYNPIGKIPALKLDSDRIMPESQVICEYLERRFPEPPLIPADAEGAAQTELVCRLVDMYLGPALSPFFAAAREGRTAGAEVDDMLAGLYAALDHLEHYMQPGGCRAVGDDWTLADCALIPFFFYLGFFKPIYGIIRFGSRARLKAWHETVSTTDLFAESEDAMKRAVQDFMAQQRADG